MYLLLDTNTPSISDVPSLWTVPDSASANMNAYSLSNDRKAHKGNEIKSQKPDKKYDALMMDRNLTPNDKIEFLAANFYPSFGQDVAGTSKERNNIEHRLRPHEIRKRRALYDDMSYVDDTNNGLLENSKYNGDWYRYLMANFPQLSNEEQRERQQDKTVADIIKDVEENINGDNNNNNKSVSSGRQKLSKDETKATQRSRSVDKLWYLYELSYCLSLK